MARRAVHIPPPTDEEIGRIRAMLSQIGGKQVVWGSSQVLEVLLVERRLAADREASERVLRATWILTGATVVLAVATVGLIIATLAV